MMLFKFYYKTETSKVIIEAVSVKIADDIFRTIYPGVTLKRCFSPAFKAALEEIKT